jgi:hypothetical protein
MSTIRDCQFFINLIKDTWLSGQLRDAATPEIRIQIDNDIDFLVNISQTKLVTREYTTARFNRNLAVISASIAGIYRSE